MNFHIITIFPEIFDSYFSESIIKRAQHKGIVKIKCYDLRNWTSDKHRTVDDRPYGGGAGMVMLAEPIINAVNEIKSKNGIASKKSAKTILFSPGGKNWNQKKALEYTGLDHLIMVCGRYEGVDARVNKFIDEEVSIGPYVLSGGEIPAMVLVDSITRLIPGAVGNEASLLEESYGKAHKIEYPQYTRPEKIKIRGRSYNVPKILLSGDHAKIEQWRKRKMKEPNE